MNDLESAPRVRHQVLNSKGPRHPCLLAVLQLKVLVLELVSVDALASSTISLREVSALNHEVLDHAVECRALIAKALLASGQGTEVLRRLQRQSACTHPRRRFQHTLGTVLP